MARGDLNASRVQESSRGNAVSDRDIEMSVMRVLTSKVGLTERTVMALQELAGQRGEQGFPRAAVRRADLSVLARVPQLQSQPVSAAPTAAEFNALRDDMRRLYEALENIARALKSS